MLCKERLVGGKNVFAPKCSRHSEISLRRERYCLKMILSWLTDSLERRLWGKMLPEGVRWHSWVAVLCKNATEIGHRKEGDEAKLAALSATLKNFTAEKILVEGPAKALAAAKSFLDNQ